MDAELVRDLKKSALKKLELLITPTLVKAQPLDTVKKAIEGHTSSPCEVYLLGDKIIARFETESAMNEACLKLSEKEEQLGFKAERNSPRQKQKNEIAHTIDIAEQFPIETVAKFMAQYSDHTEPIYPIQKLHAQRQTSKLIKSDPNYSQLKKFKDPWCNGCWKVKSLYTCLRTNKPFCSVECLQAAERDKDEVMAEIPKMAGSTFVLVSFSSARDLCLRRSSDSEYFIRNMNKVAGTASLSQYVPGRCTVGTWVMARFKDIWYRGQVTKPIGKTLSRVLLTDLGHEETFLNRQLKRVTNDEISKLKCTVIKCTLDGVLRDGISFVCEELFEKLIKDDEPLIATNEDVDRLNLKVGHTQGRFLSGLVNEKMTMKIDFNEPSYFQKDLPVNEIVRRENVPMLVTDLTDAELGVSLAHAGYFQKCYQYEEHFQEFPGKIKGNNTPANEELCLVQMPSPSGETRWLRAVGLLSCGDGYPRLELLDYGMVVKAPIANIRKLPKELLYAPAALTYAPLDDDTAKGDSVRGWISAYRQGVHSIMIDKIEPADENHRHARFSCPKMSDKIQQNRT